MIQHPGSAAIRFLKNSGYALGWAAAFGALFALLLYFRPSRAAYENAENAPLHFKLRTWAQELELWTYDWRARALGRDAEPSRDVVVVALDDGTLAEAARDRDPEVAMQPWPRAVVGGLVHEMVDQGAKLVLLDFPFAALSPRTCPSCVGASAAVDDDLAFRKLLDQVAGKSVLGFDARPAERRHVGSEQLLHELALVDQVEDRASAAELIREVLAVRRPAYSIPDGSRLQVWAAVASEGDAKEVLARLDTKESEPVLRARTNAEAAYEVSAADLLVWLSEVKVEGLDPAKLLDVKALEHPAAPLLGRASGFGGVIARPDPDGVLRALPLVVQTVGRDGRPRELPSMQLAAAMKLAGTTKLAYRDGRLHVGDAFSIPMDEEGFALVRWDRPDAYDAAGTLDTAIPAWNVLMRLRERQGGHPRPKTMSALDGRVVVFTNATRHDGELRRTPVAPSIPSGAIIGQSLANLLRSEGIVRVAPKWDALAALALAFAGALLALTFSGTLRSGAGAALYVFSFVAAAAAWIWFAHYLFVEKQQWIAMAGPLAALGSAFGLTTVHAIRTEREVRDFIISVLGRSVSPEVARQVARNFNLIRPERREVTVYFSDLEGFTRISEQAAPDKLVKLLEEYFAEMSRHVRATNGHLDKFMGDAVMALWNAPNLNVRHAERACESALRMRDEVLRRADGWEKKYGYRLVLRAGLNTGSAVVGHMGSNVQSAYTAIGEPVNFASRLEDEASGWGAPILVGEATWEKVKDAFVLREVDRVRPRNRPGPVRVFELLARKGEGEDLPALVDAFEQALALYRERRFEEAAQRFGRLATDRKDAVSAAYVERCRWFLANPPPAEWDGAWPVQERREA